MLFRSDDGRLTDNKGVTVNFKNTIIIMTSNIGSHLIQKRIQDSGGSLSDAVYDELQKALYEQLKQTIRPEFLNRIDDVIVFHPLGKEHLRHIVDIQLKRVHEMLTKQHIRLVVPQLVKDWLAERGFDPLFGARPLKRLIQSQLVNKLATVLLSRDGTENVEFEVVISKGGDSLDFVEIYTDVSTWAEK